MNNTTVWYCPKGLDEAYGISVNRQKALRSNKMIPYHKRGHYIRYKEVDIDAWWDEGKVV